MGGRTGVTVVAVVIFVVLVAVYWIR